MPVPGWCFPGKKQTLPESNIFAPENGWLEDDCFLLGRLYFQGLCLVSGSVDQTTLRIGGSKGSDLDFSVRNPNKYTPEI